MSRCLFSIAEQAAAGSDVEILVVEGDGGLGDKVNAAADEARGDWITVVDDDDMLSACWLAEVLPLLADDPDYVGLRVLELADDRFAGIATTSGESRSWDGPIRLPVPKGVTRTSIVRRVPFGNHFSGDRDWASGVAALVRTWRFTSRVLYIYDYRPGGSVFSGGLAAARDVGWWPFDESMVRRIRVD